MQYGQREGARDNRENETSCPEAVRRTGPQRFAKFTLYTSRKIPLSTVPRRDCHTSPSPRTLIGRRILKKTILCQTHGSSKEAVTSDDLDG